MKLHKVNEQKRGREGGRGASFFNQVIHRWRDVVMGGYRITDATTCLWIHKVKVFDCRKCCRRLLAHYSRRRALTGSAGAVAFAQGSPLESSGESDALAVSWSHR